MLNLSKHPVYSIISNNYLSLKDRSAFDQSQNTKLTGLYSGHKVKLLSVSENKQNEIVIHRYVLAHYKSELNMSPDFVGPK